MKKTIDPPQPQPHPPTLESSPLRDPLSAVSQLTLLSNEFEYYVELELFILELFAT